MATIPTFPYDVVVIGGGHAGCEAALACARMGHKTALVTMSRDSIAQMSCNPAIGGLAKGQLVKEIDALGGVMGRLADKVGIQFKMLNKTRGPAVWSPRAQADKKMYQVEMKKLLEREPNLEVKEDTVTEILVRDNHTSSRGEEPGAPRREITGVRLASGLEIQCRAVIVAPGTFMNGVMHIGLKTLKGGRAGEVSSVALPESLRKLGLKMGRLKTGTSPRVSGRTLDFSKMTSQPGDDEPAPFSYLTDRITQVQLPCYVTRTSARTHEIIRENLDKSPLYSGKIKGVGPRYCPSIEDKTVKFPERISHQLFLEPEGRETDEYYINGLSTSLPEEIQEEIVRSIPGLENAKIVRPGYAVEYDFVFPSQLSASLEVKNIDGLFLAGQINGTSGYEEAASQGLVAGLNAALSLEHKPPFLLSRSEAYIGVLIDDIVTKTTEEPYRMFTSQAEYRLILRQDNAPERLLSRGHGLGLIDNETFVRFQRERMEFEEGLEYLKKTPVPKVPKLGTQYQLPDGVSDRVPGSRQTERADGRGAGPVPGDGQNSNVYLATAGLTLAQALKKPEVTFKELWKLPGVKAMSECVWTKLEIALKYEGYIQRQERSAKKLTVLEATRIPKALFETQLRGLSREAREKLVSVKPSTVGQALRIQGVSPSDVSILLVQVEKFRRERRRIESGETDGSVLPEGKSRAERKT